MIKFIKKFIEIRKRRKVKPVDEETKDKKKFKQYTKCLVTALTIMACIWITISYIYAGVGLFLYGNTEVLVELSKQVCVTILGVTVSYCTKAFLENYSEAKHLEDMTKIGQTLLPVEDDGEPVG